MAISGVGSYSNSLYQWQAQQLKSNNSGSANSASSSAATSLFGGSASMVNQVSSMVELTKYVMEQMGVSTDSRVTFSQIARYREQLEQEFNEMVKTSLASSGIEDVNALTFELGSDGLLTAVNGATDDRKLAQAWLKANPNYGETLLKALPTGLVTPSEPLAFSISGTGKITVINAQEQNIQKALDEMEDMADEMRRTLREAHFDVTFPMSLGFDEDGNLVVDDEAENAEEINAWLKENSQFADAIRQEMEGTGIEYSSASLHIGNTGFLHISINNARIADAQEALDTQTNTGKAIREGLEAQGIHQRIDFSIQVNADGTVSILSDHPDAEKVQKIFNMNPELGKKYRQIETLASLDEARAAMQVSPSEMRKRIQVESMAAWWSESGNSSSWFGRYANDSLSLLSGLNLSV